MSRIARSSVNGRLNRNTFCSGAEVASVQCTRGLRIKDLVQLPSKKTVKHGLYSLRFRGSMLWSTLSVMIKSAKNGRQFKIRIKDWTGSL